MATPNQNKKFMERLLKGPGAATQRNVHADVLRTPSPSLNWTFGLGQGLPKGYTMLLFGPPRGGKSIICNAFAGQLHQDNPNAFVIKFDTEYRQEAQADISQRAMWGIDEQRYIGYDRNDPELFDYIATEIDAMCDDGMEVGLLIIDSTNMIQGVRGEKAGAGNIMTTQMGDNAITIQNGLKNIIRVQRKHHFGVILTCHIRSQFDVKTAGSHIVHTSQTAAVRPAASYALLHGCEYYMYVNPAGGAEAKTDLLGNEFRDNSVEDLNGKGDKIAHKVRVRMLDSSFGPKGREGEFTLNYDKGIVNAHEEVFLLGVARGIIEKPNNSMYSFNGTEWRGKPAILEALRTEPDLQKAVLAEIKRRDLAVKYTSSQEESP